MDRKKAGRIQSQQPRYIADAGHCCEGDSEPDKGEIEMTALEELWHNSICMDKREIHRNKEYARLVQQLASISDILSQNLSEEQWQQFELYDEKNTAMLGLMQANSFAVGFRLGARIMQDVLKEESA